MTQFVMSKFATQDDLYAAMNARIAELEAENAALTEDAIRLYQGLVRARQNLFLRINQEEVMARDFPRIAALKS